METNAWRNQCNHRSSSHSRTISRQLRKPFRIAHKHKHLHHQSNVVCLALFDPPPFQPEKLTVCYTDEQDKQLSNCSSSDVANNSAKNQSGFVVPRPVSRKYTLTHNDITGALRLSVGSDYNYQQISGFYTRLLRDEVIAEWRFTSSPSLHIFCHVSGEERWLAPPQLRNYIFRRELPLVLDTFLHADRHLLNSYPELQQAEVYVHFQSAEQELDRVELWGILGLRRTWQPVPTSVVKRLIRALVGLPDRPGAEQEALLHERQQLLDQYQRRTTQQQQHEAEAVSAEAHSTNKHAASGAQLSPTEVETSQPQQQQQVELVQQCSSSSSSQIVSESVVDYLSASSSSSVSRNGTGAASTSASWQVNLNGNGNGSLTGTSQTVGTNRREVMSVGTRRSPRPSVVVAAAAVVEQGSCTAQQDSLSSTTAATTVYGGVLHPPQSDLPVQGELNSTAVLEMQPGLQPPQEPMQSLRQSASGEPTFGEFSMSQNPIMGESRIQGADQSSRERVHEPLQVVAAVAAVGQPSPPDARGTAKAMQVASSQTSRLQVASTSSSRTRG